MSLLITICARGGSKGIPGKNIKLLNQKPLIGYTIDAAKEFQQHIENTDIALSTDSQEIKQVAESCGLHTTYTRPNVLAGDTAGKIDAITDVLRYYQQDLGKQYDYVLDMDVTSPLRNLNDLLLGFEQLKNNPEAVNLFSVSPASRSPYFNMVEQKPNGFFAQVKIPETEILARQSACTVYDMNASFYFYRRSFFEKGYKGAITDKSLIYIIPHICFDLDSPMDFEFLSFLITNNKLDFEL
jgi:CMP-N-acetylneuraminic acid synthetase